MAVKTRPPAAGRPLKVRAVQLGYYGEARRRVGDVFTLVKAEDFSDASIEKNGHSGWMEWVDPSTPDRITTGLQDLRQKHDEIRGAKTQAGSTVGDDVTGDVNLLGGD